MGTTINFKEFLNIARGSYNSIDLRCAAAQVNGIWQNGLTILRFSYKSKQEIQKEQQKIEGKWGKVDTNKFKILLSALDIDNFGLVCKVAEEGQLTPPITPIGIQLDQQVDLLSLQTEFPSVHGWIEEKCPTFQVTSGKHLDNLYTDEELTKSLWDLGFITESGGKEAYEVIREFLEIRYYQPGTGFSLLINAPLYAYLRRGLDIERENNQCGFMVEFHKNLANNLEVSFVMHDERHEPRLKSKQGPLEVSVEESEEMDGDLRLWSKQIRVPEITTDDSIQVTLLLRSLRIIIDHFHYRARDLLKPKEKLEPIQNPLVATLQRFCHPQHTINDYLERKEGDRPQDRFEQRVTRFLNLCGFSVVRLGGGTGDDRFEILKDKLESKVQRGTADILAYSEKLKSLLLVGCTLEIPSSDDIIKLKEGIIILRSELFKNSEIRLIPLFFADMPEFESKEREEVKILCKSDLQEALNDLLKGQQVEEIMFKYFLPSQSIVEI